jgi:GntR family transcriptional repressor for pyruvate dehydrogenase complex
MTSTPDLRSFAIAPIPQDGSSRPHYIAERLRQKFLTGSLRPGDRVPPERELATALRVSRSALREGLRILEAEGLLNIVHGRGTYVVDAGSRTPDTKPAVAASTIVSKEVLELMQVRRILEPEAAALAARHFRLSDAKALRRICERGMVLASREAPALDRLAALNRTFHLRILAASGNRAIERIVAGILDLLAENSLHWRCEQWALRWPEHIPIAEAITAGEADAARSLMIEHLKFD